MRSHDGCDTKKTNDSCDDSSCIWVQCPFYAIPGHAAKFLWDVDTVPGHAPKVLWDVGNVPGLAAKFFWDVDGVPGQAMWM